MLGWLCVLMGLCLFGVKDNGCSWTSNLVADEVRDVIDVALQQLTLLANIAMSVSQSITVPYPLLVRVVKMKGKPLVF
jgi:hypothetical protein